MTVIAIEIVDAARKNWHVAIDLVYVIWNHNLSVTTCKDKIIWVTDVKITWASRPSCSRSQGCWRSKIISLYIHIKVEMLWSLRLLWGCLFWGWCWPCWNDFYKPSQCLLPKDSVSLLLRILKQGNESLKTSISTHQVFITSHFTCGSCLSSF